MIRQATIQDISNKRITKLHGRLVAITRCYPRFLKRILIHDYFPQLAPQLELLKEFKRAEATIGDHDQAFVSINYESKFYLSEAGIAVLRELVELSQTQPIYLVCHCGIGQCCHRELILLMAKELFNATISKLSFDWTLFHERMKRGDCVK